MSAPQDSKADFAWFTLTGIKPPEAVPSEHVGLPVNVGHCETITPFGDYRDLVVLQVIRDEARTPVADEPMESWVDRAESEWRFA